MSIHLPCFCTSNLFTPPLRESVIYAVFARVSYLRCFCVSQLFTLPLRESVIYPAFVGVNLPYNTATDLTQTNITRSIRHIYF